MEVLNQIWFISLFILSIIGVLLWIGSFFLVIKNIPKNIEKNIRSHIVGFESAFFVAAIAMIFYYLIYVYKFNFYDPVILSALSNLSITIIPAYAALIILPLTISVVHYSKIYPLSPLNEILVIKAKSLFILYFAILVICAIEIIFIGKLNKDSPQIITLVMLILLFSALFVPLLHLQKQIKDILTISPYLILQIIVKPNELLRLFKGKKFDNIQIKFRQGLSLVRSCIIDLALREYIKTTIDILGESINAIPWFETSIEMHHETLLLKDLINSLDEYVIDPLKETKFLPNADDLQPLLKSICCAIYKLEDHLEKLHKGSTSGIFYDFLKKLSIMVDIYAKEGKWGAIRAFYTNLFIGHITNSRPLIDYAIISSMLINLASIAKTLPVGRIPFEFSVDISIIFNWGKSKPEIFMRFNENDIDALRTYIKIDDFIIFSDLLLFLAYVINLIPKEENEFLKEKAISNLATVIDSVKQKLSENNLGLAINHEMKGLSIIHLTTHTISNSGISDEDLKALNNFLDSQFREFIYILKKEDKPGKYRMIKVNS